MKTKISILAIVALISSCTNKKPLAPVATTPTSFMYNVKIDATSPHANNMLYSSIRIGTDDNNTVRLSHSFNTTFHLDTMIQGDGVNVINYALACVKNSITDSTVSITFSITGNGLNFNASGFEIFKP